MNWKLGRQEGSIWIPTCALFDKKWNIQNRGKMPPEALLISISILFHTAFDQETNISNKIFSKEKMPFFILTSTRKCIKPDGGLLGKKQEHKHERGLCKMHRCLSRPYLTPIVRGLRLLKRIFKEKSWNLIQRHFFGGLRLLWRSQRWLPAPRHDSYHNVFLWTKREGHRSYMCRRFRFLH